MPPPPSFPVRLLSARPLSPSVRELVFVREDGPLDFVPGQWLSLVLPVGQEPGQTLRRSYSIASAPDGTGRFELAVTRVTDGPGSTLLHRLEPGDVLQASGPQGFFEREAGLPSLLLATGTGITPLRSMLHAALARGAREPLTLLLGVRHEEDILYRDELEKLHREHSTFRFLATLSRPGPGWAGLSGYVQHHLPSLWADLVSRADGATPHLYLCGLERMVKVARDLAKKQLGLGREQIHSERFD